MSSTYYYSSPACFGHSNIFVNAHFLVCYVTITHYSVHGHVPHNVFLNLKRTVMQFLHIIWSILIIKYPYTLYMHLMYFNVKTGDL
jgi:hypothetical protein